jgi:RHS repeat-associated protein
VLTDLGFAGGHLLPNGQYHFGARFYDPALARWTQEDPLNPVASQQDANRYGYAGANPINSVDPYGTSVFSAVKHVVKQTVKHPFQAASVVDTAAVGAIAPTAGSATVGGGYATYREGKEFYEGDDD